MSPLRVGHCITLICCVLVSAVGGVAAQEPTAGPSLTDRLSGFDEQRIQDVGRWLQTPQDAERMGEAAKLLFQVNRLARTSLAAPPKGLAPADNPALHLAAGDAVSIRGTATALASAMLPVDLADSLEFDRIYRVEVQTDYTVTDGAAPAQSLVGPKIYVLTTSIPSTWSSLWAKSRTLDQPTAATGVVVQANADGRPRVIAAAGMAWFPRADSQVADDGGGGDWALLARQDFNVSLLDEVRLRNRKPLLAADHEAFYAMLKAADEIASLPLPPPPTIDASELLRNAPAAAGRRLRLHCQSVRITRITLSNPALRASLGSDHYWQIDALGDLGNVVIRIEASESDAEPVTFENRYPVSIVALTLPDFLQSLMGDDAQLDAARSDVLMISRQLIVDGFFYRLWSYESDYMRRRGGGNQFGPLLMATQLYDDEPPAGDPLGVAKIGQAAAAAALVMLIATGVWIYVTSQQDSAARARRRSQGEPTNWPAKPSDQ